MMKNNITKQTATDELKAKNSLTPPWKCPYTHTNCIKNCVAYVPSMIVEITDGAWTVENEHCLLVKGIAK